MVGWLAAFTAGAAFTRWSIDEEGWATTFLLMRGKNFEARLLVYSFQFESFMVREVPVIPSVPDRYDRMMIDVLVDPVQLASAFMGAFEAFVRGPAYDVFEWEAVPLRRAFSMVLPRMSVNDLAKLSPMDLSLLVESVNYRVDPDPFRPSEIGEYLNYVRQRISPPAVTNGEFPMDLRSGPNIPADLLEKTTEERVAFIAKFMEVPNGPWDGDDLGSLLESSVVQTVRRNLEKRGDMINAPFHSTAETIPNAPGAYVLLIHLDQSLALTLSINAKGTLDPGRYLYCGSAKGPGGLKARLSRHMSKGKKVRWHIDRVTEPGKVIGAWVVEGGNECDLADALNGLPIPIYRFGSTDCDNCPSHLFAWPSEVVLPFLMAP